uniref:Uncharacterized protein n=1 Tax=Moorena producens (strain JHB) TaxID=1454205 RepID=A0A1D9G8N3_MOOP1
MQLEFKGIKTFVMLFLQAPCFDQGYHYANTGGQMSKVAPINHLTSAIPQGFLDGGVNSWHVDNG